MRVKEGGFHLHCLVGVHLFSFYFFSLPSLNLLSFLQTNMAIEVIFCID